MLVADVGEIDHEVDRAIDFVLARHRQCVVLVVAVKRLIEVGLAGELGPRMALVHPNVVGAERRSGAGDEGGMQPDQVEFGSGMERQVGGVRELGGVAGLGVEVLVGRRIVGAQVPVHLLHAVDTRS